MIFSNRNFKLKLNGSLEGYITYREEGCYSLTNKPQFRQNVTLFLLQFHQKGHILA